MDDDYFSSIKRLSKMKVTIAIALFVAAVAIFVGGKAFALVSRHTVESRIAVILKKKLFGLDDTSKEGRVLK